MSSLLEKITHPVCILGAGALGRFLARELKQKEIFSLRERTEILPEGVRVLPFPQVFKQPLPQTVIFAGKSFQFSDALQKLRAIEQSEQEKIRLLILSNGMGLYEEAAQFWRGSLLRGVVNTGVQISSDNQLRVLGEAVFVFAADGKAAEELEWKKAITNTVINGIATQYRCKNGELETNPAYRAVCQELLEELKVIANKKFSHFMDKDDALVWRIVHNTSENVNSLLQDLLSKRNQFEWKNYGGAIHRFARKNGLSTPHLDHVVAQLLSLGINS